MTLKGAPMCVVCEKPAIVVCKSCGKHNTYCENCNNICHSERYGTTKHKRKYIKTWQEPPATDESPPRYPMEISSPLPKPPESGFPGSTSAELLRRNRPLPKPPESGSPSTMRADLPPSGVQQAPRGASSGPGECPPASGHRTSLSQESSTGFKPLQIPTQLRSSSATQSGQPPSKRPETRGAASGMDMSSPPSGEDASEFKCIGCGRCPRIECLTCGPEPAAYCKACFLYYHPPGFSETAFHVTQPLQSREEPQTQRRPPSRTSICSSSTEYGQTQTKERPYSEYFPPPIPSNLGSCATSSGVPFTGRSQTRRRTLGGTEFCPPSTEYRQTQTQERPYSEYFPPPIPPKLGSCATSSGVPLSGRSRTRRRILGGAEFCPPSTEYGQTQTQERPYYEYFPPPIPPKLGSSSVTSSGVPLSGRSQTRRRTLGGTEFCPPSTEYRQNPIQETSSEYGLTPILQRTESLKATRASQSPYRRPQTPRKTASGTCRTLPEDDGEPKCARCGGYPKVECFSCSAQPVMYCQACFEYIHHSEIDGTSSHITEPIL